MRQLTLFASTFSTLLALINPLEALPVFVKLLQGENQERHREIARRACVYAAMLMLFFLVFGTLILRVFGVPLSMIRIAGGIVLMQIGFQLFSGSSSGSSMVAPPGSGQLDSIAFVPLAMPLMCGPGAIATVLGMTSLIKRSENEFASFVAIACAILATMSVTCLCLVYSHKVLGRIGPMGIDAVTRIVGFFVSAIGVGLAFQGVIEAFQTYGVVVAR